MSALTLTVLGSGTSVGVPTIGCDCKVCTSEDPRDQRLRPSILFSWEGHFVLVDTTPDFRQQALRARIPRIDAILYTHSHADHIMGLDDIRPFNFRQREPIPIYGSADTIGNIKNAFRYIFENLSPESSIPKITAHTIDGVPFAVLDKQVTPIPLKHGKGDVLGFRIGNAAYLTDHSDIPESSLLLLQDLDVLFLDALRYKPHPTHSTVQRSLESAELIKPKRTFFTHICHDLGHERAESLLPDNVRLAYDGLQLTIEDAL